MSRQYQHRPEIHDYHARKRILAPRQAETVAWKFCLLIAALTLPVMSVMYLAELLNWLIGGLT
jgi:hypothetical protein